MEAECTRNIELWWLLHQLMPGYHTIADFRKDNAVAFKKAFKIFVSFLKGEDMLSAEMIAIDGTKIRAQNNKKNNFNEAGLAKHVAYIENKTQEYLALLDEYDAIEDKQAKALKQQEVIQKIAILKERKQKYEQFTEILNNSDDKQISTTDPQSRSLPVKEGITNVCYNIQTVADSKHSLIVEFETINEGDQGQLSNMACKAKQVLGVEQITALADKGYHTGKQLQECRQEHITTIVAYPDRSSRAAQKQTESGLPAQNFAVIALQKRVFSRSNIRVMFVNKQSINYDHTKDTTRPLYSQYNRNLGLEYNLASSTNKWTGKAMLVKSFSPGKATNDLIHAANLQYQSKKWLIAWQHEYVGNNYNAETGYVPRHNYIKLSSSAGYLFFPKKGLVLSHGPKVISSYYFNQAWYHTDDESIFLYTLNFRDQSIFDVWFAHDYVQLLQPFDPTNFSKDTLATGTKHYWNAFGTDYFSKPQQLLTYDFSTRFGGYYLTGSRLNLSGNIGYRFQPYVSIALSAGYNHIKLPKPWGNTNLWLVGPRIDVTLTNTLFFTTFIQYNNQLQNINLNTRLQWRYKPASNLFLVYTDNYYPSPLLVRNRAFVLKFTYWWN